MQSLFWGQPAYPRFLRVEDGKAPIQLYDYDLEAVRYIQRALIALDYRFKKSIGRDGGPDGKFGGDTDRVVREFQTDMGLRVDGSVGKVTFKALDETINGLPLRREDVVVPPAPKVVTEYRVKKALDGFKQTNELACWASVGTILHEWKNLPLQSVDRDKVRRIRKVLLKADEALLEGRRSYTEYFDAEEALPNEEKVRFFVQGIKLSQAARVAESAGIGGWISLLQKTNSPVIAHCMKRGAPEWVPNDLAWGNNHYLTVFGADSSLNFPNAFKPKETNSLGARGVFLPGVVFALDTANGQSRTLSVEDINYLISDAAAEHMQKGASTPDRLFY
jgi:Putative peptidoglycan binding domain